jgi:ubiquinone/menaquinone biosynthesis C-methylase UbiE
VGTGSGRWVFEVAEEFPNAKVSGIDLSPICSDGISPKNAEFRVMDLTQGLQYPSSSIDLVHSRLAYSFSLI